MDAKLVGWGRAVKARSRHAGPAASAVPPLWMFTDPTRMPDLVAAVRALPKGLCGVVFRHDGAPGRAEMIQAVWRVCRNRRLALVVAGRGPRPAGVGHHHRAGRGPRHTPRATASAHGVADLVRARRAGIAPVFLSPAFPTASHPGAPAIGPIRFLMMARNARCPAAALGGIDGTTIRRLRGRVTAVGAIAALAAG